MNTLSLKAVEKKMPVWTSILDNNIEINSYLKNAILEHRENDPEWHTSNVKAWHSSFETHTNNPKFIPLVNIVLDACNFISREYYHCAQKYFCFNMWAMMYEESEYAIQHNHFPSDFACVYYVDVEPDCAPIIFEGSLKIQPKNGMLVLFPALIEHEVPATKGRRMVISMNIERIPEKDV